MFSIALLAAVVAVQAVSNEPLPPILRAGALPADLRLDGRLDEAAWATAETIADLTMVEPVQGGAPTAHTRVKVLAGPKALVFGIFCEDPQPEKIVSYTNARDANLENEDHVGIVLDTSRDGRSGYVFVVNPRGARFDALIEEGSGENSAWDGIWDAAATILPTGWSVEIRIPITTLNFKRGLETWNFNVQRRADAAAGNDTLGQGVASARMTNSMFSEGIPPPSLSSQSRTLSTSWIEPWRSADPPSRDSLGYRVTPMTIA